MEHVKNRRKIITAWFLIAVLVLGAAGIFYTRFSADTATNATKLQLVDLEGKPVKQVVPLEMVVYGKARSCKKAKILFVKASWSCHDVNRAYSRYATTDENGTISLSTQIAKPITTDELYQTIKKVAYDSGKELESDDISEIVESIKNIKPDSLTFLEEVGQVMADAYTAHFVTDTVMKYLDPVINGKQKVASSSSSSSAESSSASSIASSSSSSAKSSSSIASSAAKSSSPSSSTTGQSVSEAQIKDGINKLGISQDDTEIIKTIASDPAVSVPAGATKDEVVARAEYLNAKANAAEIAAKNSLVNIEAYQTQINQTYENIFGNQATATAFLQKINAEVENNRFPAPLSTVRSWTADTLKASLVTDTRITENPVYVKRAFFDAVGSTTKSVQAMATIQSLSKVSANPVTSENLMQNSLTKGGLEKGLQEGITLMLKSEGYRAAAGIVQTFGENAPALQGGGETPAVEAPSTTQSAKVDSNRSLVKKTARSMRSIGTGILGKSVAAGKFIIPDPTSFAIAVVYQALAPQIGIYEHSFQTTDIIVSTLSERFDSGKLKVSFNEDEYKASRNLSVAFRDEKLYADTSLSYFARVISSNAMTDDQKDQYSKFLDTYRKYLLNSALRGIEDSDKDQSLTDSINSFIPKPKSEPEPTSKVYD